MKVNITTIFWNVTSTRKENNVKWVNVMQIISNIEIKFQERTEVVNYPLLCKYYSFLIGIPTKKIARFFWHKDVKKFRKPKPDNKKTVPQIQLASVKSANSFEELRFWVLDSFPVGFNRTAIY